jgi:hypothetical protein
MKPWGKIKGIADMEYRNKIDKLVSSVKHRYTPDFPENLRFYCLSYY